MKNLKSTLLGLAAGAFFLAGHAAADNPLIMDQFTADPTARVFDGKVFLYPSHDMPSARTARGGSGWFAMEDYHAFSSEDLINWKDYGVIMNQKDVPWIRGNSNSMWAPDCVTKGGKYYFYFPAQNRIGVAIADKPEGPFKIEEQAITGGIDPCCFIDTDGKAYLVWAQGSIFIHKLMDNMTQLDPDVQTLRVPNLPTRGQVEGPFMFERKGNYYLTYPHAVTINGHEAEQLEYAMGKGPLGPFTVTGVIMDQTPHGAWTNHHSLVQYKDQWYLFYHDILLSPDFDKNRSVCADYLTFNDDGTIQKVIPTLRGVGVMDAKGKIQIDRYSAVSKEGAVDSFLDPANTHLGWKIELSDKDAWVEYDRVDFGAVAAAGAGALQSVNVRSMSSTGGTIEIHLDKPDGTLLASVAIPKGTDWSEVKAPLASVPSGVHNLVVTLNDKNNVDIDWVSFQ